MKSLTTALFLLLATFCFSQNKSNPEAELLLTWEKFKSALKSNNKELLKSISADSIWCLDCTDNTDLEYKKMDSLRNDDPDWYENLYGKWVNIPFEQFYSDDLPLIFDKNLLNRLDDTTKVGLGLPHKYNSYYEFLILTMDPDSRYKGFEGYQRVLQFCKTNEGYKFCGVSSVP